LREVIRATWDAVGLYVKLEGKQIPLRPTDRLVQDLGIDPDDVEWDLIPEVAERSGHSLDQVESNPIGKVETVGDFVRFITVLGGRVILKEGSGRNRYVNLGFEVDEPADHWPSILQVLQSEPGLAAATIVCCEGTNGWDDYLLLHHFDPSESLDLLGPPSGP
jgi:hypothetical protein